MLGLHGPPRPYSPKNRAFTGVVSQLGNVVFAHPGHCTRLGPSFPHFFHETHLTADFQLIEVIVQHTVTMKIDNPFTPADNR